MPASDIDARIRSALASGDVAEAIALLPEDDSVRLAAKKAAQLATVAPSEVHELHAATYAALSGIELSPKQVQVVLSLHGATQRSALNRLRSSYRGRTAASLRRGAETLRENLSSVADALPGAKAARAATLAAEAESASAATVSEATEATEAKAVAAEPKSAPKPTGRRTRKAPATAAK